MASYAAVPLPPETNPNISSSSNVMSKFFGSDFSGNLIFSPQGDTGQGCSTSACASGTVADMFSGAAGDSRICPKCFSTWMLIAIAIVLVLIFAGDKRGER